MKICPTLLSTLSTWTWDRLRLRRALATVGVDSRSPSHRITQPVDATIAARRELDRIALSQTAPGDVVRNPRTTPLYRK